MNDEHDFRTFVHHLSFIIPYSSFMVVISAICLLIRSRKPTTSRWLIPWPSTDKGPPMRTLALFQLTAWALAEFRVSVFAFPVSSFEFRLSSPEFPEPSRAAGRPLKLNTNREAPWMTRAGVSLPGARRATRPAGTAAANKKADDHALCAAALRRRSVRPAHDLRFSRTSRAIWSQGGRSGASSFPLS